MLTYDQWLDSPSYDTWEERDGDIYIVSITNRMIMSVAVKPDGWLNPFELTEQDIDKMRVEFKGSGYKWMRYVESKLPNLDPKAERKLKIEMNKLLDVQRCGSEITWIDKFGLPHTGKYQCKHYDICKPCNHFRQKEHTERLMKLDGCQVIFDQRAEMIAKHGEDNVYSFKLSDGREASVINSNEKIGTELNYSVVRELSSIAVTGNRVSGTLGIEKSTNPQAQETQTLTMPMHIIEAPQEIKKQIEREYLEETKKLLPQTVDELIETLKECNRIYLRIAHKHCDKIHFLGKKILVITEFDLNWQERQNIIEERLNAPFRQAIST